MFFSVLIPAYNCENYIDDCIESIIEQSCQDFEIVIVNDGSSDNTEGKCTTWVNRYPNKVSLISKENSGAYLTRRRLLREAKGEYVCFIDADDRYIDKNALSNIKSTIEQTKADLLFFEATTNLETRQKMFNYYYQDGEIFENEKIAEIYRLFVNTKQFQHLWNKVFKRTLVDYELPDEPFEFRMIRDGVYQIVPLITKVDKVVYLDQTLYYYRTDNINSVSHNFRIDFYYSVVALHTRILEASKTWKHKNIDTDDFVKAGCTADMCISAIKARNLPKESPISRSEYIKMISNDSLFRLQYTQKHLAKFRKPIAWALYHRQYWIINVMSSLVGIIKGR